MLKQTILSLLSIFLLASCNEGGNKQHSTTSDITIAKEETTQLKNHPAEEKIKVYLSEIERFRADNEYDSLAETNKFLMEYLTAACADETLLQYPFDSLNKYRMTVLTSGDRKFRIYCWDTETGGSMHFYNAIAQYKTENGSAAYVLNDISISEQDCGVWYDTIHTIQANNNKVYYLPVYYGRFSGNDISNGISAYIIEGNKLNDKPLIFKPKGKPLSEISYYYHNGTESKESAGNRISLSADRKTLSIPVTDKDDIVTNKSLIYKFDGTQFVYDKNAR